MSRITTDTDRIGIHVSPGEAGPGWAHVAACPDCRLLLSRDDELRRRLALLRLDEPRIDVVDQVMEQIRQQAQAPPAQTGSSFA
jgi:hypothetical protein